MLSLSFVILVVAVHPDHHHHRRQRHSQKGRSILFSVVGCGRVVGWCTHAFDKVPHDAGMVVNVPWSSRWNRHHHTGTMDGMLREMTGSRRIIVDDREFRHGAWVLLVMTDGGGRIRSHQVMITYDNNKNE